VSSLFVAFRLLEKSINSLPEVWNYFVRLGILRQYFFTNIILFSFQYRSEVAEASQQASDDAFPREFAELELEALICEATSVILLRDLSSHLSPSFSPRFSAA
jgi:hypothetical protein